MDFTAFDTEDNSRELLAAGRSGFEKQVTQIAAITSRGQTFHNRGNVIEFLKWIKQTETGILYSHNLQYDMGNLFGRALDLPDPLLVGSRLIKTRWQGKLFHDSFNLYPLALERLGAAFGLAKLPFDPNSREYVFRDCEIVLRAVNYALKHAQGFGVEKLPATIGGLAVRIWKALGGENWFDDFDLSQQSYYGGRVELFRPEASGRLRYVDVNSLYPAAMRCDFPVALDAGQDISGFGIARVTIKVPEMDVAPLPLRMDDGEVWYPYGRFTGVWTMAEIQNAVWLGAKVLKVHESYGSRTGHPYYRDFVDHLYLHRLAADKEGNEAGKLFFKLVLNNLYGQLACRGGCIRSIDLGKGANMQGPIYGNKRLIEANFPLPDHVNFSHAAYVTGYGRLILQDYMRLLRPEQLIYTDTDSIIFQLRKGERMPFELSDQIGAMKLEGEGVYARCYAPKSYNWNGCYKAKGVRKKNAQVFLETGTVTEESPYRFREAVEFYDRGNAKQLSVWRKITKRFFSNYTRKRFCAGPPARFKPKKVVA